MFHVPERSRIAHPFTEGCTEADLGNNGAFLIDSVEPGWQLFIIASDGEGWEHVSVHARRGTKMRTPTWREMAAVKRRFWDPGDVVVQYHPREQDYVNTHEHVLHLWRPIGVDLPTPPVEFV